MISFVLNDETKKVDVEPEMPLLWVLREELGMRGTKFGCGISMCGACTVHVDGKAVRSCVTPMQLVANTKVKTIEALGSPESPHPVQQAWLDHQVPQCGYCQSGMQMAATALLESNPNPTDDDINKAITNICRCGCYERIRAAIHDAAASGKIRPRLDDTPTQPTGQDGFSPMQPHRGWRRGSARN
ncbi:MAG: (2Fe-2S)-binding protein, partial [Myxococcota bacterium]